jgi:hypothetical protein
LPVIGAQSIAGMVNSFHRKSLHFGDVEENRLTSLCVKNVESWAAPENTGYKYNYGTVVTYDMYWLV